MIIDPSLAHVECDVLVVGGGGAALRATVEAASLGADVLLVTKGRLGSSGATSFGVAETAGFAVPDGYADPQDSPEEFLGDILRTGQGCADPELAAVLAVEAVEAADYLRGLGLEFMRADDGDELVALGDFASRRRNRKIYGHGKPIAQALCREVVRLGVTVRQHTTVIGLVTSEQDGVVGAVAMGRDGVPVLISAAATVLATGGAGQLFTRSLMPPDITGGGYVLALRAGARLVNMEFIQAGFGAASGGVNMVMPWYWALRPHLLDPSNRPLLTGAYWQPAAIEAAMSAKSRHYPFSCSDPSGQLEITAKRALDEADTSAAACLYLDFRAAAEAAVDSPEASSFWKLSEGWLLGKGIDVRSKPMEVALFGHSVNGGATISPDGQTEVPGLLAAGEVAGGPYGADRPGGSMLLACQVFGRRAGALAARLARERPRHRLPSTVADPGLDWIRSLRRSEGGESPYVLRRELKQSMTRGALVVRSGPSLQQASLAVESLADAVDSGDVDVKNARDAIAAHEVRNLCTVGRVVLAAATHRRESRGSHYRVDHPTTVEQFSGPIFVSLRGGQPVASIGQFGKAVRR